MADASNPPSRDPLQEPAWLRLLLIGAAVLSMALLVVLPLAMVLASAFGEGFRAWWGALAEPDALAALRLTLFTAYPARIRAVAWGSVRTPPPMQRGNTNRLAVLAHVERLRCRVSPNRRPWHCMDEQPLESSSLWDRRRQMVQRIRPRRACRFLSRCASSWT